MAGDYVWARSQKIARKKLMRIKKNTHKLTIIQRAKNLDNRYGNRGKAYYYIFDKKKRRKR